MSINLGIRADGKIVMSVGPQNTRKDDLKKWLNRNSDAILVQLQGASDPSFHCSVGHLCRIEESDDQGVYNVFVGSHLIGHLPDEAVAFAERIESSPPFCISIVGKIEDEDIYIYIAE